MDNRGNGIDYLEEKSNTPLGAKKENITQKEYEKKKERIERENAKKQICLDCKKKCEKGTCEIFPHG